MGCIIAFIIWLITGIAFIIIGLFDYNTSTHITRGFWANIKTAPAKDVKLHNKALGKLFIIFGIVFIVLGVPLLMGQNSPAILITIIGVMFEVIAVMAVYIIFIEGK